MRDTDDKKFILEAIRLARKGMEHHLGGPFGALIVKEGVIIGRGQNRVTSSSDPTAHAEILAIREACQHLEHFQLEGCTVYSSCEPCPMCLGAIYWSRPDRLVYACTRRDAAEIGFDDHFIYEQLSLPQEERSIPSRQLEQKKGLRVFKEWEAMEDKISY